MLRSPPVRYCEVQTWFTRSYHRPTSSDHELNTEYLWHCGADKLRFHFMGILCNECCNASIV
jgi:hypothetical protein